jgi:hypothetical protein
MSLWRRTRTEVAGAWRSLRYDLDRRTDDGAAPATTGPDVTSTGMSTFGGSVAAQLPGGYDDEFPRRPRRAVAVSAFAALAVAGAAGSYFAVVHGLGSLLAEKPAAAEAQPYPLVAAPPAADHARMGRGSTPLPGRPARTTAVAPRTAAAAPATPRLTATGRVTVPVRRPSTCDCLAPPVPTPTAPSPSPSPSASPSPSHSADGSVSPSPSASPTSSATFVGKRHAREH